MRRSGGGTGARLADRVHRGKCVRLLRHRKSLGCDVKVFADVDIKHSAASARPELREEVEEIVSPGCADTIIVTRSATAKQAALEDFGKE